MFRPRRRPDPRTECRPGTAGVFSSRGAALSNGSGLFLAVGFRFSYGPAGMWHRRTWWPILLLMSCSGSVAALAVMVVNQSDKARIVPEHPSAGAVGTKQKAKHADNSSHDRGPRQLLSEPVGAYAETTKKQRDTTPEGTEFTRIFGFEVRVTDLALVVFNGLLVAVTWLLWRSGERARLGQQFAQRAAVFLDGFETNPMEGEVVIFPRWKNTGTTATKRAENYINWKSFPGEPPADYSFPALDAVGNPLPADSQPSIPMFIGAQATQLAHPLRIQFRLLEAAARREVRIFSWGWIRYTDVFGEKHITRFCNEIEVTQLPAQGTDKRMSIAFPIYTRHNCADDECSEQ